jgi:hypothetical protein
VDLFEAVADEFEGLAQAAVERGLELFIDCLLHGDELLGYGAAEALDFFTEAPIFFAEALFGCAQEHDEENDDYRYRYGQREIKHFDIALFQGTTSGMK